jgi:hypothetical protein
MYDQKPLADFSSRYDACISLHQLRLKSNATPQKRRSKLRSCHNLNNSLITVREYYPGVDNQ